mgnify:CR=1 FL=1
MKSLESNELQARYRLACELAKAGAELAFEYYQQRDRLAVDHKGDDLQDVVSVADKRVEAFVKQRIQSAFPEDGFLGEESGARLPDARVLWVVDPIDGTTNFIHGFPVYCVSIAMAFKGKVEHAVVYDPSRNDLFTATRGRGAFLNERRIRVSKRTQLKDCLVSTGFPFRPGDNFKQYMAMMAELMPRTAGLRRPGAAALDLAYVAAGRVDGFFEIALKPWDFAAGELLVREAGGLVCDFTGGHNYMTTGNIVAGNPRVVKAMLANMREQLSDALKR